jgi:hypothetical protein
VSLNSPEIAKVLVEDVGKYVTHAAVSFCHLLTNSLTPCVCCCCLSGFHEFAEFVAEDVGTVDSGLNSMVLANNNEMVLLPINEPTFGTKRKSQIQVRSY